ncbi:MAG: hypothetical protein WBB05_16860 [Mycolicibacterium fortuitum]
MNNAPPTAVLAAAADTAAAAIDQLTARRQRPDERITVLSPMNPPFDRTGIVDPADTPAPEHK